MCKFTMQFFWRASDIKKFWTVLMHQFFVFGWGDQGRRKVWVKKVKNDCLTLWIRGENKGIGGVKLGAGPGEILWVHFLSKFDEMNFSTPTFSPRPIFSSPSFLSNQHNYRVFKMCKFNIVVVYKQTAINFFRWIFFYCHVTFTLQ